MCITRSDSSITCIKPLHIVRVNRHILLRLVYDRKGRRKGALIVLRIVRDIINLYVLLTTAKHYLPTLILCRNDVGDAEAHKSVFVILRL